MIVAFNIHISSLSSPLLLRISPKTFAFIPIPSMCLSSPNRSNSKAFRHILPCVAPLCKALHYSKTRVPWQTMRTFIFSFISFQILSKALYILGSISASRGPPQNLEYWVCGIFLVFAVLSFLLKIEHIFSVKWYIRLNASITSGVIEISRTPFSIFVFSQIYLNCLYAGADDSL